jgi:hypothetical protein
MAVPLLLGHLGGHRVAIDARVVDVNHPIAIDLLRHVAPERERLGAGRADLAGDGPRDPRPARR